MKIQVTQEHIDKGKRWDVLFCPIALALEGVFPGQDVHVFTDNVDVCKKNSTKVWYSYKLDEVGSKFIEDFDNGSPVSPITVELSGEREITIR